MATVYVSFCDLQYERPRGNPTTEVVTSSGTSAATTATSSSTTDTHVAVITSVGGGVLVKEGSTDATTSNSHYVADGEKFIMVVGPGQPVSVKDP